MKKTENNIAYLLRCIKQDEEHIAALLNQINHYQWRIEKAKETLKEWENGVDKPPCP